MFFVGAIDTVWTLCVGISEMGARVERLLVGNEDSFVDAADVEDLCWAKLCADDVDGATCFAVDGIRWNRKDIQRAMVETGG